MSVLHLRYSTNFSVTRSSLPAEVDQQTWCRFGRRKLDWIVQIRPSVGKLIWKLGTFATNLIFLHLSKGVFTNYRIWHGFGWCMENIYLKPTFQTESSTYDLNATLLLTATLQNYDLHRSSLQRIQKSFSTLIKQNSFEKSQRCHCRHCTQGPQARFYIWSRGREAGPSTLWIFSSSTWKLYQRFQQSRSSIPIQRKRAQKDCCCNPYSVSITAFQHCGSIGGGKKASEEDAGSAFLSLAAYLVGALE